MPDTLFDGIRLHWEEHVPKDETGRPVVLLHGLGSSGDDWQLQTPALGMQRRLLMPDLPGHGRSQGFRRWARIGDFAAAVSSMLRAAHAWPAHVVGLSLGGEVALQMAVDSPEQVASLAIVNGLARFRPSLQVLALGTAWLGHVLSGRMEKVAEWVAGDLFPEPDQAELRQEATVRLSRNERGDYLRSMAAAGFFNVLPRLATITRPTLIVTGELDRIIPIDRQREIADGIPRARMVVVPRSRHATPIDAAESFNSIIKVFLEEVEPQLVARQ
jgi:pimeloyl-ACP methyl ester carboxylesterase